MPRKQTTYIEKPILIIDSSLYRGISDEEKYCIEEKASDAKWENLLDVEEICVSNGDFPPVNEDNDRLAANIVTIDPSRSHFQLYLSQVYFAPRDITFLNNIDFIESLYIDISDRSSRSVVTGSIAH